RRFRGSAPSGTANVWLWSPKWPFGDHNRTFAGKKGAGRGDRRGRRGRGDRRGRDDRRGRRGGGGRRGRRGGGARRGRGGGGGRRGRGGRGCRRGRGERRGRRGRGDRRGRRGRGYRRGPRGRSDGQPAASVLVATIPTACNRYLCRRMVRAIVRTRVRA